ncbi:MAG: endonuclease, partial [Acholeplasmataceae bacterium]|nr:endonuclease [Acholeplasmataceae bacterium]
MAKLLMTVEQMQDKEAWLKARNSGIGGSDAGIIVGLNKWKSPFQLWLEKTGQVEAESLSDNEFVYWGNVLEQVVADEFTVRTGKKVMRRG